MLCNQCKKKTANFHYKQIINGQVQEVHLCDECAAKQGYFDHYHDPFDFGNILNEFLSMGISAPKQTPGGVCSKCGMEFDTFRETGLLGCPACYEQFSSAVRSILPSIQAGDTHKGKICGRDGEQIRFHQTVKGLKEKLKRAILDERYEDAAKLRDELKNLEGGENRG